MHQYSSLLLLFFGSFSKIFEDILGASIEPCVSFIYTGITRPTSKCFLELFNFLVLGLTNNKKHSKRK